MADEVPFTAEEMAELRKLLEVEKIRKVMQLYSHLMDARDFKAMANLYAEDAFGDWGPYGQCRGRAAIHEQLVKGYPGRLPYDGLHTTTNFWIELTGKESAISRSYLTDVYPGDDPTANPVMWYALYENEYRKVGGDWKIACSVIQWLWPKRIVPDDFPHPMKYTSIG